MAAGTHLERVTHATAIRGEAVTQQNLTLSAVLAWGPLGHAALLGAAELGMRLDWAVPLAPWIVLFWIWPLWLPLALCLGRSERNVLTAILGGCIFFLVYPSIWVFTGWLVDGFV